jgi:hypothetical protein
VVHSPPTRDVVTGAVPQANFPATPAQALRARCHGRAEATPSCKRQPPREAKAIARPPAVPRSIRRQRCARKSYTFSSSLVRGRITHIMNGGSGIVALASLSISDQRAERSLK